MVDGSSRCRMAFAHDWLTGMRGGEQVLECCCREWPSAELYTLLYNPQAVSETLRRHRIHTSFLQNLPAIQTTYRYYLPILPFAAERLKVSDADLLISFSHCVAKGAPPPPGARHLCYCFTPMRYAWTFYEEYFGTNPLKKLVVKPLLAALRRWDRRAAVRVDRFVAISEHVRKRIERHYQREADIVYPPADLDFYTPDPSVPREEVDLMVSALVPYKKADLAVRAYTQSGHPLRIIGTGTETERLRAQAGPNIRFDGWLSNEDIREAYRRSRRLIFPGEEDFGIVPVEAQACGCPVVAFGRGGALETVKDRETGVFFNAQTEEALNEAVERASAIDWDPETIRKNAERFGRPQFLDGLKQSIDRCLAGMR